MYKELIGLGIGIIFVIIFIKSITGRKKTTVTKKLPEYKTITNEPTIPKKLSENKDVISEPTIPKEIPEHKTTTDKPKINPYAPKKYIFTNNEFACYKNMKIVADKYGLEIFCKVRFADLIDTKQGKDFSKWFNRVKSKHIDFVLLDGKTITPKILIELDDNSHNREKIKQRDQFVDAVCAMCQLKIKHIRSYNADYIERILIEENVINNLNESQIEYQISAGRN